MRWPRGQSRSVLLPADIIGTWGVGASRESGAAVKSHCARGSSIIRPGIRQAARDRADPDHRGRGTLAVTLDTATLASVGAGQRSTSPIHTQTGSPNLLCRVSAAASLINRSALMPRTAGSGRGRSARRDASADRHARVGAGARHRRSHTPPRDA